MADVQSPLILSQPPPTPLSSTSSSPKSGMTMLYYGLAVVGTAAIVLAMYNLIIIRRCSRRHGRGRGDGRMVEVVIGAAGSSSRSFECSNRSLLSSFRYKKEAEEKEEGGGGGEEYECPVCLSEFEEGEEVRRLPRCSHSFHAICIDMWLYSHLDCPICRTPVGIAE